MKFGVQTIVWGHGPLDFEWVFDVISAAGFAGVEIFQHPLDLPPVGEVRRLLDRDGKRLELLGLTSGTLKERVAWLDGWKDPYLYIDEWDDEANSLMDRGYRLAVHPHYLMKIDSHKAAEKHLQGQPKLLFIPDTAQAEIKRDKITDSLARNSGRLAAVHIKDWRPGFGRASASYARGFTDLGKGEVADDVLKTLDYLRTNIRYQGWVVVEQDYAEGIVEESISCAARWLQEKEFIPRREFTLPGKPRSASPSDSEAINSLRGVLDSPPQAFASNDAGRIYRHLAGTIRTALGCSGVAIWSCSEFEGILSLQAIDPPPTPEHQDLALRIEQLDPEGLQPGPLRSTSLPEWPVSASPGRYRLPIRSNWNPHQTRLVVDLYAQAPPAITRLESLALSRTIARAFDNYMDGVAASCAAELNMIAVKAETQTAFVKALRKLAKGSALDIPVESESRLNS